MKELLCMLLCLTSGVSMESQKFASIAEQGYDTSCGLSTLADLLHRYWNFPVSEQDLLNLWIDTQNTATEDYAVSFADMIHILSYYGFYSKAFRFTYAELVKATVSYTPILVHFADQEGHFALCLAATDEYLVIADPAEGTYWLSREDFLDRWKGYSLLVTRKDIQKDTSILEQTTKEVQQRREALYALPAQCTRGRL